MCVCVMSCSLCRYVNMPTYAHRETLAETGLKTYLQMLLKDNFIHAVS